MEPLEFSKTGKKRRLKRQIFCFCGVTVVSSTVFEREISCQHVDVNMRMLRFFSVEKPGIIPRWGQSVSDRDFHTCLFFTYNNSATIGRWTVQVTSMRGTCGYRMTITCVQQGHSRPRVTVAQLQYCCVSFTVCCSKANSILFNSSVQAYCIPVRDVPATLNIMLNACSPYIIS